MVTLLNNRQLGSKTEHGAPDLSYCLFLYVHSPPSLRSIPASFEKHSTCVQLRRMESTKPSLLKGIMNERETALSLCPTQSDSTFANP